MAAGCVLVACCSDEESSDLEDDTEDENTWKEVYTNPGDDCYAFKDGDRHEMGKNMLKVSANILPDEVQEKTVTSGLKRMELNDHKAGMEKLDKKKINSIIFEASKGSRFYENELKKEAQVTKRIERQTSQLMRVTKEQKQDALKQADFLIKELEATRDLSRTIVHIDMDAFFAAAETRENPNLQDKPMAVGSIGMLSTSNYEARKYGVRAAMPGFIGKKLCPDLIIVTPRHDKYREISHEVREILAEYDPNFVPMSLDEAYLDLTEYLEERRKNPAKQTNVIKLHDTVEKLSSSAVGNSGDAEVETVEFGNDVEDVVREIRFKVEQKTQLTASAGIAPNAMLAKVCSDRNKPNGQFYLKPDRENVLDFVQSLSIRKISGIGRVSEQMLRALGVEKCKDLYAKRDLLYLLHSQISCRFLLSVCLGVGETILEGGRQRKSLGTETTFPEINQPRELHKMCENLCQDVVKSLESERLKAKTVTVKLKTVTFEVKERSQSFSEHVASFEEIFPAARELLWNEIKACQPKSLRLRLMGVRLSNFQASDVSDQIRHNRQDTITGFLSRRKPKSKNITSTVYHHGLDESETLNGNSPRCSVVGQQQQQQQQQQNNLFVPCIEEEKHDSERGSLGLVDTYAADTSCSACCIDSPKSNSKPTFYSSGHQDTCTTVEPVGYSKNFNVSAAAYKPCFVCPICDEEQPSSNEEYLIEFNRHVDLCLSKSAIKEMLSEDKKVSTEQCLADNLRDPRVNSRKRGRKDSHGSSKKITLHRFWAK